MLNFSFLNIYLRRLLKDATNIHLLAFLQNFTFKKFLNFSKANLFYLLGVTKIDSFPYTLTIDITNNCNLHCKLCPTGQGETFGREKRNMTFKEFKTTFDQFKDYIFILHLYVWGEPFLNPDIFKMIRYAKKHNVFVSISSNFNFDEMLAEKIISSGLDHIMVGLDGTDQSTYEKYRKGGKLRKVLLNIKNIVRIRKMKHLKKPILQIQFLVFKHNQNQILEAKTLARSLKVDQIDFIKGSWTDDENFLSNRKNLEEKEEIKIKRCLYPWSKAVVFADGGLSVCSYSSHKNDDLGNLFKDDFLDLWNAKKLQNIRKQQKQGVFTGTICDSCSRWKHLSQK